MSTRWVSVDGFIADAEDNVGPLFEWYFNGDAEIVDSGAFKASCSSGASNVTVQPVWPTFTDTVLVGASAAIGGAPECCFLVRTEHLLVSHSGRLCQWQAYKMLGAARTIRT